MSSPGEAWALTRQRRAGEETAWKQFGGTESLSPQDEVCMHLTNYAINKHNENFIRDDTVGSKRYCLLCFLLLLCP